MLSGHRTRSRRGRNSRAARIAVPLAIPMALGLTLGIIIAASGHNTTQVTQSALGDCVAASASPAAYASELAAPASGPATDTSGPATNSSAPATNSSAPATTTSAPATTTSAPATTTSAPATTTSAPATTTSAPATTASGPAPTTSGPAADPQASTAPCPSGSASASDPAPTAQAAAAANVNCDIIVPANPLSAQGLATPWQLTGPDGTSAAASGCTMTNAANLGAYVQATILNPRTGALSVYNPLVVTQGTTPAVAPVVPRLPRNAIVTIDVGFNGTDLTQVGATPNALQQGRCVNGLGSVFGQVSFCNGINFFNAAFALEREGLLRVPSTGRSANMVATAGAIGTGTTCPTTRNFDMVDQDPSDNVTTKYLLNPATGQTAQDNAANTANMADAQVLVNGSDNALLDNFLDPAFGCTPFMAPDLGNNGAPTTSQALDELLAARNQPRTAALVPENDEMVLDANGQLDTAKTDLYRAEIGQAPVDSQTNLTSSPAMFCQNMVNIQTPFLAANQNLLSQGATPVPAVGENLFTFMANRLNMSFTNLGCQNFGLTNPVTVVLDGNGAAMSATFNTTPQQVSNTTGAGGGGNGGRGGNGGTGRGGKQGRHHHHHLMDPSGE
jgi:hypothetical protein